MKSLTVNVLLLAVLIVSCEETDLFEKISHKISSLPYDAEKSRISLDCSLAIASDLSQCLEDVCSKYNCQSTAIADYCGMAWFTMDCTLNAIDNRCSSADQQSSRDEMAETQKELEETRCKDYPRNASLKTLQNLSLVLGLMLLAFMLRMTYS
jgi:hypothetical protein